jgi:hypothetical protein
MTARIVCLTPTRDEAWVVGFTGRANAGRFDVSCYYDQRSADGTDGIVAALPGALLRANENPAFNEAERQLALIAMARELGARAFVALDADELLMGPAAAFRAELDALPPGTAVHYEWINVAPGGERFWSAEFKRLGFVDDGSAHRPLPFHSERVPEGQAAVRSHAAVAVHLQYLNRVRFCLKHVDYLEREFALEGNPSRLGLFRKYSHMLFARLRPVAEVKGLAELLAPFLGSGAACLAPAPLALRRLDFVRRLLRDDEWLLLHLVARWAAFAGCPADVGPRLTPWRRAAIALLEACLRQSGTLPSRVVLRLLRPLLGG